MAQSSWQLYMISQFLLLQSSMGANSIWILTIEEKTNIGLYFHPVLHLRSRRGWCQFKVTSIWLLWLMSQSRRDEQQYNLSNTRESCKREPPDQPREETIRHNSSRIFTASDKTQMTLWLRLSHFSPNRMDEVSHGLSSSFPWGKTSSTLTLLNLSCFQGTGAASSPVPVPEGGEEEWRFGWMAWGISHSSQGLQGLPHAGGWVTAVNTNGLWNRGYFTYSEKFQVHWVQFNFCPKGQWKG